MGHKFVSVILLLMVLLFASPMLAQTATQCQAEAALWGSQTERTAYLTAEFNFIHSGTPNRMATNLLSLKEIDARNNEMLACMIVDLPHYNEYNKVQDFYLLVTRNRYMNFVRRHHLQEQFDAEDNAGIR